MAAKARTDEREDDVKTFRETFDADSVREQLKTVVQESVTAANDMSDRTIKSLELANEALTASNDSLREKLEQDWRLPRIAFAVVTALFGLEPGDRTGVGLMGRVGSR